MSDSINRRRFISTAVAASSVGLVGCSRESSRESSKQVTSSNSSEKVEATVAIHVGDVLDEYMIGTTPSQVTSRCFEAIECAVEPIKGLSIDRYTETDLIPISDYVTGNPLNAELGKSEVLDILSDHTSQIDADSHTLLTGITINDASGVGRIGGEESAVEARTPLFKIEKEQTCSNRTLNSEHRFLTYLIHEIGHTFGLRHEHGRITKINENEAYPTPMLSRYMFSENLSGTENHFGEWIPDVGDRTPIEVPYFNYDIGIENTKFV